MLKIWKKSIMDMLYVIAVFTLICVVSPYQYVYSPSDPFPITRNVQGLKHHVGCRLVYQPIRLVHSKCQFSRQLLIYGCAGYCGSDSNLMYRNPWSLYQLERKCYTCDADRRKMRKFTIHVCPDGKVQIPVPASCICQKCSIDFFG